MKSERYQKADRLWCNALLRLIKNSFKDKSNIGKVEKLDIENLLEAYKTKPDNVLNDLRSTKESMNMIRDKSNMIMEYYNEINNKNKKGNKTTKDRDGKKSREFLQLAKKQYKLQGFNRNVDTGMNVIETRKPDSAGSYFETNLSQIKEVRKENEKYFKSNSGKTTSMEPNKLSVINKKENKFTNEIGNDKLKSISNKTKRWTKSETPVSRLNNIPISFRKEIEDASMIEKKILPGIQRQNKSCDSPNSNQRETIEQTKEASRRTSFVDCLSEDGVESISKDKTENKKINLNLKEDNSSALEKELTRKNKDITSSVNDKYKRTALALEKKKTLKPEKNKSVTTDDSLENLQRFILGKKSLLGLNGGLNRTEVLESKITELGKEAIKPKETATKTGMSGDSRTIKNLKLQESLKEGIFEQGGVMTGSQYDCHLNSLFKGREFPFKDRDMSERDQGYRRKPNDRNGTTSKQSTNKKGGFLLEEVFPQSEDESRTSK